MFILISSPPLTFLSSLPLFSFFYPPPVNPSRNPSGALPRTSVVVGEFRKFSTVRVSILFGVSAILNNSTVTFSLPPFLEILRRPVSFYFIFFSASFYFLPSVSASGCAVRRRQVDEEWNDIGRGKGGSIWKGEKKRTFIF